MILYLFLMKGGKWMFEIELVGKDELLKVMIMCNSCLDFNLNDLRGKGDNNY